MSPPPGDGSLLAAAIEAIAQPVPQSFSRFHARLLDGHVAPDFTEHSVRFGEALAPHRITHYFDVPPGHGDAAKAHARRFVTIADALGHPIPDALHALLDGPLVRESDVAQIVLGIDARADERATRSKLYVVLRSAAAPLVAAACAVLDVAIPARLDPTEVFIVGVDAGPSGLVDTKLYLRLDRARLARTVRNIGEVRALADGARTVVLQQCVRGEGRRQLHFHARDVDVYAHWLEARAASDPSVRAMLAHAARVDAQLAHGHLGPWIVGLPYDAGILGLHTGNVYFHVSAAPRRAR